MNPVNIIRYIDKLKTCLLKTYQLLRSIIYIFTIRLLLVVTFSRITSIGLKNHGEAKSWLYWEAEREPH